MAQSDDVFFLTDKQNEYLPLYAKDIDLWQIVLFNVISAICWIYIYWKKIYMSILSPLSGLLFTLIVSLFWYYMKFGIKIGIAIDKTTGKVLRGSGKNYFEKLTDLTPYMSSKQIQDTELVVDGTFLKKKKIKSISLKQYYKERHKKTFKQTANRALNVLTATEKLPDQGYSLIQILFTVAMLSYDSNRKMFTRTIFPMFKYGLITGAAVIVLWHTFYDVDGFLNLEYFKTLCLISSSSVILSLLVELIVNAK